jgi:hypothetical protein
VTLGLVSINAKEAESVPVLTGYGLGKGSERFVLLPLPFEAMASDDHNNVLALVNTLE